MTLSRSDYYKYRDGSGSLREYLALAGQSIDIVSISLNVTQAEGDLISLFSQKILESPTFRVRISLLAPSCAIVAHLAKSLGLESDDLRKEIEDTLRQLERCKAGLASTCRDRLEIYVHETLPIGSAILLDALPDSGRIQVETKLYQAPRTESFGFETVGPSAFYKRNFTAWHRVFDDSYVWTEQNPLTPAAARLEDGNVRRSLAIKPKSDPLRLK
jgi:hypothetical protein